MTRKVLFTKRVGIFDSAHAQHVFEPGINNQVPDEFKDHWYLAANGAKDLGQYDPEAEAKAAAEAQKKADDEAKAAAEAEAKKAAEKKK
jgi:hypothetical protein